MDCEASSKHSLPAQPRAARVDYAGPERHLYKFWSLCNWTVQQYDEVHKTCLGYRVRKENGDFESGSFYFTSCGT